MELNTVEQNDAKVEALNELAESKGLHLYIYRTSPSSANQARKYNVYTFVVASGDRAARASMIHGALFIAQWYGFMYKPANVSALDEIEKFLLSL